MTNPNVIRIEVRPGVIQRYEIDDLGEVLSSIEGADYGGERGIVCLSPCYVDDTPLIKLLFPNGYTTPPDPEPEPAEEITG